MCCAAAHPRTAPRTCSRWWRAAKVATNTLPGLVSGRDVSGRGGSKDLGRLKLTSHHGREVAEGTDTGERELHYRVAPEEGEEIGGSGTIDSDLVAQALKRELGRIRACYERALRHDPGLAGKLSVAFTLEQAGTVSGVRIDEDTLGDAGLRSCVVATLSGLRIAAPTGGSVQLRFPFVFESQ